MLVNSTREDGVYIPPIVDNLMSDYKWGGEVGSGVVLTYSIPGNLVNDTSYWDDSITEANSISYLSAAQVTMFELALLQWGNIADITFSRVEETSSSYGVIRVAISEEVEAGGAGAWAYYPSSYWETGGDVWLNHTYNWTEGAGSWELETLMHELGHALGLTHPLDNGYADGFDTSGTIMSYNDYDFYPDYWYGEHIYTQTPMIQDVAAIQYMYGANLSYQSGNDIYDFDPTIRFAQTLWDAGGVDAICVDDFATGCRIDLREGHYSDIVYFDALHNYTGGSNNLGIAYGAVIENAIGGSGDDEITGNDFANKLTGNGGNDTIDGMAGNDIIDGGAGNDTLIGSLGADTLTYATATHGVRVNLTLTTAQDTIGAGSDTLSGFENLAGSTYADILIANAAKNTINGGGGNDTLKGLGGNDILNGGGGKDTLIGGAGGDIFMFNTAISNTNFDTITDFNATDDTIKLENAIFKKLLTAGTLNAAYFKANLTGKAADANDYIVYETDTGKLFYDADGSGTATAAIQIALLGTTTHPTISAADFVVV
ncbi:MAG: M10 family metallopeptidase C-terminal domain-containing protein [Sulfurimonas sp.]|nr:M10 family metallopeptidase C-terminal domain-containing protein [Sulfurimonas sp.]